MLAAADCLASEVFEKISVVVGCYESVAAGNNEGLKFSSSIAVLNLLFIILAKEIII